MADTAAADKKQDGAEEEALQAKAFEALERDFQEVSTRAWKLRRAEKALPCSRPQEVGSGGERKASERAWAQAHGTVWSSSRGGCRRALARSLAIAGAFRERV